MAKNLVNKEKLKLVFDLYKKEVVSFDDVCVLMNELFDEPIPVTNFIRNNSDTIVHPFSTPIKTPIVTYDNNTKPNSQ